MENRPCVSVIMVCYNHRYYIREAIDSILNQSYSDFELIIIDDGSSDNTTDIIKGYKDNRILFFQHSNYGPSIAINKGLQVCKGEYVALMSGDDVSVPNRLELQIRQIEEYNADIIFSLPIIIGSQSELLGKVNCPVFFGKTFTSTAELYRLLFYGKNFLCATSCFLRSNVVKKIGWFNPGYIQLQDFDYWIRACKTTLKIMVFTNEIVRYRSLLKTNLSSNRNIKRTRYEEMNIFRDYFENVSHSLLSDAFNDAVDSNNFQNYYELEYIKVSLLTSHPDHLVRLVGKDKMLEFLGSKEKAEWLISSKNFNMMAFFESTNMINFDELQPPKNKMLLFKRLIKRFLLE